MGRETAESSSLGSGGSGSNRICLCRDSKWPLFGLCRDSLKAPRALRAVSAGRKPATTAKGAKGAATSLRCRATHLLRGKRGAAALRAASNLACSAGLKDMNFIRDTTSCPVGGSRQCLYSSPQTSPAIVCRPSARDCRFAVAFVEKVTCRKPCSFMACAAGKDQMTQDLSPPGHPLCLSAPVALRQRAPGKMQRSSLTSTGPRSSSPCAKCPRPWQSPSTWRRRR